MSLSCIKSTAPPECPHCHGHTIVNNGQSRGRPRLLCRTCQRSFYPDATQTDNSSTRLPHKFKLFQTIAHLPMTLRNLAQQLDISLSTAYRWRHMYLATLCPDSSSEPLQGVVATAYLEIKTNPNNKEHESSTRQQPPLTCYTDIYNNYSGNTTVGKTIHLIEYDNNTIKRQLTIATSQLYQLSEATQAYLAPGTILTQVAGHCARFNGLDVLPRFTHIGVDRNCEMPAKLVHCVRAIYTKWMLSFRGIALRHITLYTAWFNASWRLLLPKYWQVWMPPLSETGLLA